MLLDPRERRMCVSAARLARACCLVYSRGGRPQTATGNPDVSFRIVEDGRTRQHFLQQMQRKAKVRRASVDDETDDEDSDGEHSLDGAEVFFHDLPEYPHSESFQRVAITEDDQDVNAETREVCAPAPYHAASTAAPANLCRRMQACRMLLKAVACREKYFYRKPRVYWGGLDKELYERHAREAKRGHLRRRADPPFEPFGVEVPPASAHELITRHGIIFVHERAEDGTVADRYACMRAPPRRSPRPARSLACAPSQSHVCSPIRR